MMWILRGKRNGANQMLSAAPPAPSSTLTSHSLCDSLPVDFVPLASGWVKPVGGRGEWCCGSFFLFVVLQVGCVHFLKATALFIWHSPCNCHLRVWIATLFSSRDNEFPLLVAHGYYTISGLFPETYSWQIVSLKNSPQITCSEYVLLGPWLIYIQHLILSLQLFYNIHWVNPVIFIFGTFQWFFIVIEIKSR